ncbi:family 43 glycosylhydrolase [Streptomyces sp. NPDC048424]|uniref:family 43 glycosylhydrolase n=1 Tax=Streptomyces sp. NPDC048424 TaxID=3155265 RepID=UPI00343442F7
MLPISRRNLLKAAAGAGALPLLGAGRAAAGAADATAPARWVGAGTFAYVYDPSTAGGPRYLNDHTLIKARGRWHLFSIVGDSAPRGESPDSTGEIAFAHASAPSPNGPWTTHADALTLDPSYFGEEHLWAPHVVEAGGRFWMFYAGGGRTGAAISLATSADLFTWTREPSGPLFRGLAARDPMVLRVGGEWVMYYTELSGTGGHHVVAHRRSADLLHWSEPGTAFTDATTDTTVSVTESPYVVERDGWYYLFIGPRGGYEGTDVLASRDPFRFDLAGYAGHVAGHAVEVVADGEEWYASAAGWFRNGLHVAPLYWRDTPPPWQSPDNPVAGLDVGGRLTVFALDAADRSMLRRVQLDPDTDTWSPWESFGGPAGAVPAIGRNTGGRLEVFSLAPEGANLHHRVQRPDGGWYEWEEFGGPAGAAPAVARDAAGRLEAFALSPGGASLARRRQGSPGSLAWDPWEPGFGGAAGAPPVVAANADGRLEVFVLSPGGAGIHHRWQEAPGGAWTTAWQRFVPRPAPHLGWPRTAAAGSPSPPSDRRAWGPSPGGSRYRAAAGTSGCPCPAGAPPPRRSPPTPTAAWRRSPWRRAAPGSATAGRPPRAEAGRPAGSSASPASGSPPPPRPRSTPPGGRTSSPSPPKAACAPASRTGRAAGGGRGRPSATARSHPWCRAVPPSERGVRISPSESRVKAR